MVTELTPVRPCWFSVKALQAAVTVGFPPLSDDKRLGAYR